VDLGGRSSTYCEVGCREVSGLSDSEGQREVMLRDPWPEKQKKKKRKKKNKRETHCEIEDRERLERERE
jgi:hypothetical protein